MSHFWNSDHFHLPVLTDGWGKQNFTRKNHTSTFAGADPGFHMSDLPQLN